jgi:hypothetical protein
MGWEDRELLKRELHMAKRDTFRLVAGIVAVVAVCVLVSAQTDRPGYPRPQVEVQTSDYGVEPAQSDAARAIDMAEKVALQGQQLTQSQLISMDAKLDKIAASLAAMDKQMSVLNKRLANIEQKLGIAQPTPQATAPAPAAQTTRPVQPAKPGN